MAPDNLKPVPLSVAAVTFTGAVPEEVKITDWVLAVPFAATLPNATLLELTVSLGTAAFSLRAKPLVTLPAVAATVTDSATATGDTVAVKLALADFAETETVAGTVTAVLLLDSFTLRLLAAGALSVTVQTSVPEPVRVVLLQDRALNATVAVDAVALNKETGKPKTRNRKKAICLP